MSVEQFVGVPEDIRLGIIGYPGLTYDKVLNNPDRYLSRLKEEPADILCIDIGTNDLCGKENPPSVVVQKTKRFLDKLFSEGIRPRQIVLFSVIQRSVISRPGQVPLSQFNHRAKRYNAMLTRALEAGYPYARMYAQRRINFLEYLSDGCHLNHEGIKMYCRGIKEVLARYHS